jgi:DNA-binding NarL/FixJ family response regulator
MPTPQFNVRVPEQYHDLLRLIVERLRANPDGADALADALSAVCRQSAGRCAISADSLSAAADSLPSSAVSDRLDAITADVEDLKVRIALLPEILDRLTRAEETTQRVMAFAESINDGIVKDREARAASPPASKSASKMPTVPRQTPAKQGAGGDKQMTDEQDRQIADMLKAGRSYREIAKVVDVSPGALSKIKKRLGRQGLLTAAEQSARD